MICRALMALQPVAGLSGADWEVLITGLQELRTEGLSKQLLPTGGLVRLWVFRFVVLK